MIQGLAARQEALRLLEHVLDGHQTLASLGEGDLPAPDRARARRLAEEVLRRIEPADRVLDRHLRRRPPLAVMNALRLALVEMALGTAPHGAVNAAVAIVRGSRRVAFFAGLVNAVLRKVAPETLALERPQRLPAWLRGPVERAWGPDVVAAIEAAHAQLPPLDLTLRDEEAGAPEGRTYTWRRDKPSA